ncbi:MAG: hypothetical protein HFF36_03375 [Coprobacillus sp.]|nr:hypothetical protein [Coprobacillus sp.]
METKYIALIIMIIIVGVLLYYGFINLIKNKGLNTQHQSTVDIELLLNALGGVENIQDISYSSSKLTVLLINQDLVDITKIQNLGASGVVEGKNKLAMIFGKQSALIAEDMKKYM